MIQKLRTSCVVLLSMALLFSIGLVAHPQSTIDAPQLRYSLAAARSIDVHAPEKDGNSIKADAKLSLDCSNTYGCWNYMKIERKRVWGWQYVGGNWVTNDGWNNITLDLPAGCFDYRTFVDSYNDVLVSVGEGIDIGPVGVTEDGQEIHRFKTPWNSGSKRICR